VRPGDGGLVWFAINVITSKGARGACECDVMRVTGKRIIGRVTYQLRLRKGSR
jgi:hypothetical protein